MGSSSRGRRAASAQTLPGCWCGHGKITSTPMTADLSLVGKSKKEDGVKEEKRKRDSSTQPPKSAKPPAGGKSSQQPSTPQQAPPGQPQQGTFVAHKEIKLTLLNKVRARALLVAAPASRPGSICFLRQLPPGGRSLSEGKWGLAGVSTAWVTKRDSIFPAWAGKCEHLGRFGCCWPLSEQRGRSLRACGRHSLPCSLNTIPEASVPVLCPQQDTSLSSAGRARGLASWVPGPPRVAPVGSRKACRVLPLEREGPQVHSGGALGPGHGGLTQGYGVSWVCGGTFGSRAGCWQGTHVLWGEDTASGSWPCCPHWPLSCPRRLIKEAGSAMNHQTRTGRALLQPSGPTHPQTEVSLPAPRGQGRGTGAWGCGAAGSQTPLLLTSRRRVQRTSDLQVMPVGI